MDFKPLEKSLVPGKLFVKADTTYLFEIFNPLSLNFLNSNLK